MEARVSHLHLQYTTGHAAAAREADTCDMAEIGSPNEPAEHVMETNNQVKDEATNGVQDDVQNMEAEGASKPDGAVSKGATGEDSKDAVETQKQEEEKPKPSKLKVLWAKLGLDPVTLILMFK